jgi:hypothetical protein
MILFQADHLDCSYQFVPFPASGPGPPRRILVTSGSFWTGRSAELDR